MKKAMQLAGVAVGALALSVLASAQSSSSQRIQQTPVPGRTTPMAGGLAGTGPAAKADCSNNGWQNYPSQSFKDQKSCESYVHKHASTKKGAGAHSPSRTPRPGTSPGPGQSSTTAPTPQSPR